MVLNNVVFGGHNRGEWADSDQNPVVEKPTCVSGRLMIFWREIDRNRIESNIWVRVRVNLRLGLVSY